MLREPFERCLIDTQDDVADFDASTLCGRLARKQLFNPHHAGARGFIRNVLLATEAEAQSRCVLQQTNVEHIICGNMQYVRKSDWQQVRCGCVLLVINTCVLFQTYT